MARCLDVWYTFFRLRQPMGKFALILILTAIIIAVMFNYTK